jgi:hypothetical protein
MRHVSILVAACLLSSGADASNSSSVKELGIEVHFTQCTDAVVGDAHFCGEEVWTLDVVADGWRSEHASIVRDVPGRWTATCSDGVYRADIDGRPWAGTCRVTGDQERLCFETKSTTGPGDLGGELTQCFELSGDACRMDYQGKVWQQGIAGEIVNQYGVSSRDVTVCMISDE